MPLSDDKLASAIYEVYEEQIKALYKEPPYLRFEQFAPKKEEKVSYSIDLILSPEKFLVFVADLQEMSEKQVYKRDEKGNRVIAQDGGYEMVDVPVNERWINTGDIKRTDDGKIVVRTNIDVLANMEALAARRNRIKAYQED